MNKVKGFSYDPEKDRDVIEHIDKQPNKSQYIWELVRRDIKKENNKIEDLVRKYIEKHLKDYRVSKKEQNVNIAGIADILNME